MDLPEDAEPAAESFEPIEPAGPSRARQAIAVLVAIAVTAAFLAGAIGALFRSGLLPEPTTPPDPGLLAVVDAAGDLSTVDGSGAGQVAYPAPGGPAQFPAWSPDGNRIAAIRSADGGGTVHVHQAGEPSLRADVYDSPTRPPFYLSWSPDGNRLTFLTTEPAGIALRVAPSDGSADATLVDLGAPFYWDWVDPARLMVHVGGTGPGAFVGDVDLGGARLGDLEATPGFFRAPAATADGRLRAYVAAAADGTESIVLAGPDGADRRDVAVGGNIAFGFDPAGSALAFVGPAEPAAEPTTLPIGPLRIVDAATGAVRTALDGPVVAFFWSPDGRTIAALELIPDGGPAPDEAAARVASTGRAVLAAADDPPGIGLHLVFVDAASGTIRSERDVRVGEVFAFQLIPYFDQYALSHRVWSPDSRSLVLPVVEGDATTRIVTFPADGSAPTPIADGVAAFWSP